MTVEPRWKKFYTEEEFKEKLQDPDAVDELLEIYSKPSIWYWRQKYGYKNVNSRSRIYQYDPEEIEEILWKHKRSLSDITRETGVKYDALVRYLEKHNIKRPRRERWRAYFTLEELKDLLRKGISGFRVIQEKTDYSQQTYYDLKKKYLND